MSHPVLRIAAAEWQHMVRTRLALTVLIMLIAVIAFAAVSSTQQLLSEAQARAAYQLEAEETFRNQPARHPHRMVHYGHYVFRSPAPLAVVDPGVDPYTGRSIFLEGHRRNTATFAEARETSVLTRFGLVSPAFALQVIAPLLLILLGYAGLVRERQRGTMLQLMAQGVSASSLVGGKAVATGGVALLALLPLLFAVTWVSLRQPGETLPALSVFLGHAAYLGVWVLIITAVSALARSPRAALVALVIFWAVTTVVVPRIAADAAATAVPSQTQTEMDIQVQRELREVGDSHDINDPAFTSFQDQVLREYGVDRIEDLPVNYRGLVSLQGEAEGSEVMNRHAAQLHQIQRQQATTINLFTVVSPYLAVRNLSMRSAGSDLLNHQRFLDAAEAHRFELIQELNEVHAHELSFADDSARSVDPEAEQRTRVDPEFWNRLQDFRFEPYPAGNRLAYASPLALILALWLMAALLFAAYAVRRMEAK